MPKNEKKELILDAMQCLMNETNIKSVSISEIAKAAGIGKGSIYYYFKSKEEIIEAVIERNYSAAIEKSKTLLSDTAMDALTKMKIIYRTCRDSSIELLNQEANNYFELQQSALLHQQFIRTMIKNLGPILSDIIRQGNAEGIIHCINPDEIAEIVLIVLTIKTDNHIIDTTDSQIQKTMKSFADMLETSFQIEKGSLAYLWSDSN